MFNLITIRDQLEKSQSQHNKKIKLNHIDSVVQGRLEASIAAYKTIRDNQLEDLKIWFPYHVAWLSLHEEELLTKRFKNSHKIYSETGIQLLKERYLRRINDVYEPIAYMHLRFALYMKPKSYYEMLAFLDAFNSGLFALSSTINYASIEFVETNNHRAGEACSLISIHSDVKTMKKDIMRCCNDVSDGIGVGVCVSNVSKQGNKKTFPLDRVINVFDAFSALQVNVRKSNIALYVHIHCDTVFDCIESTFLQRGSKNIFVGLMTPNLFIEKVKAKGTWYFFDADTKYKGKPLHEYYGKEYVEAYEHFVELGKFTKSMPATEVMSKIILSLKTNGTPYIIWSDQLNTFNNHDSVIKTLNLCAEVTNAVDDGEYSRCTLISATPFWATTFPSIINKLFDYCFSKVINYTGQIHFEQLGLGNSENVILVLKAAFLNGYMGSIMLNNIVDTKNREIGISPFGIFDTAQILQVDVVELSAACAEILYLGAVAGSLITNNPPIRKGKMSKRQFQFDLRKHTPKLDNWNRVRLNIHNVSNMLLTSQAPTAITSNLFDLTESVQLPIQEEYTLLCTSIRTIKVPLGILINKLNKRAFPAYDVETQLNIYKETANFIDHSQSTVYHIDPTDDAIKNVIVKSYNYKLKTGIYYITFNQFSNTLRGNKKQICDSCN